MAQITLVGSTGLVGAAALASLLSSPTKLALTTLTRRAVPTATPANPATTLTPLIHANLVDAVSSPDPLAHAGSVYITALGTTRAAAGSLEGQEKIDYIILVSSGRADSTSYSGYLRIKGLLEDAVLEMGFKRTVILRPGVLLGRPDARFAENALGYAIRGLRWAGLPVVRYGIDAADVGAAVAQLALESGEGVRYVYGEEMVALATTYRAGLGA